MKNIDYKIFVPRGERNYLKIENKEFIIDEILTVNIHLADDKITYWFYLNVSLEEEYYLLLLKNIKKLNFILLIGNNPYEIFGVAEIINIHINKRARMKEFTISFVVTNASETYNNPRKVRQYKRTELIDLED